MTPRHRFLALVPALALSALSSVAVEPARATTPCSAAPAQAAAQKYLDALTDRHAAWSVPLHPRVTRIENGLLTGFTATELRLDLFLHLQLSVTQGVEDVVWTYQPDGRRDVINATFFTPVGLPGLIVAGSTIDEDFTMTADCRILHIDATFTVEPPR
jgi:hypothetical protein